MKVLVGAFPWYEVKSLILSRLSELGFNDLDLIYQLEKEDCQKMIDSCEKIDIMILGGAFLVADSCVLSDKEAIRGRIEREAVHNYELSAEFAQRNNVIPSIM